MSQDLPYNPKKRIYDFILVFLLVLNGGSIIRQSRVGGKLLLVILLIYVSFLLIKYLVPIKRYEFLNSIWIFLGFFILFILQMMFLPNNLLSVQYLTFSFQIMTILLIIYYGEITKIDYVDLFYKVLIVVLWHAIIAFVLWFPLDKMGLLQVMDLDGYRNNTFLHLFYYRFTEGISGRWNMATIFGIPLFVRNQGLFWEPGVLQIFMNILLYLSLSYYKSLKYSILSILVIITTWSTSGIVIAFLQLTLYITKNIKKRKIFYTFPIIFTGLLILGYFVQNNLNEKIGGAKEGSTVQRQIDTLSTVNIIKQHPWVGIGMDTDNYRMLLKKSTVVIPGKEGIPGGNAHVSNSLLYLFTYFGIPLGLFLLYAFYRQNIFENNRVLFFLIVMLSALVEPVLLLPFFTFFLISGVQAIFFKSK